MRPALSASVALVLALVPALELHAHPHVFISSRVAVDFEGGSLARVSVEWTFDELFSQMIFADFDKDRKGSFTEAEAAALKKGAFDNLRNYHYFLAFFVGGKAIPLPPIRDFRPSVRDGKLVYSFFLPLELQIASTQVELRITIYDDTYYVAFDKMSPADIELRGGDAIDAAVSIEKTKVKAEWPGQFMPDQIVLRMKRK
jgi:ABC-type uncharacterized transport system substrate-binding protein